MIVRRTLEGAEKCALRDFLLEEDRAAADEGQFERAWRQASQRIQVLILVILSVLGESGLSVGDSKVAGRHGASKSEAARRKFSPGCGPHGKFSAARVAVCLGWLRRLLLPQARALDAVGFALLLR
jgi:hypothetical protein